MKGSLGASMLKSWRGTVGLEEGAHKCWEPQQRKEGMEARSRDLGGGRNIGGSSWVVEVGRQRFWRPGESVLRRGKGPPGANPPRSQEDEDVVLGFGN